MTLHLEDCSLRLGPGFLLRPFSMTVRPGEVTVIIGPNGAGKSTLLKIMSGGLQPESGRVLLDGRPLSLWPAAGLAARRAFLAQDYTPAIRFSVAELIDLGLSYAGRGLRRAERRRMAAAMAGRVGLAASLDRDVSTLSGGERQRAHLARVLAQLEAGAVQGGEGPQDGNAGLLLLDEPLAAQDLSHQQTIMRLARAHARGGGSVVMVLHDLNWASVCADRLAVLRQGALYADGPPDEVLTSAMLAEVFEVRAAPGTRHAATGRPYIIPHDLAG